MTSRLTNAGKADITIYGSGLAIRDYKSASLHPAFGQVSTCVQYLQSLCNQSQNRYVTELTTERDSRVYQFYNEAQGVPENQPDIQMPFPDRTDKKANVTDTFEIYQVDDGRINFGKIRDEVKQIIIQQTILNFKNSRLVDELWNRNTELGKQEAKKLVNDKIKSKLRSNSVVRRVAEVARRHRPGQRRA